MWLNKVDDNAGNPRIIKILVGNKSDLEKGQRKVTIKEGKNYADARQLDFYEVSALQREGGV